MAILAYRQFFEQRRMPVLVLKDPKVKLEGAMSALIVNADPLGAQAEVVAAVRDWLDKAIFAGVPDDTFQRKWAELPDHARLVVASLIDEGGRDVKEVAVRKRLKDVYKMEPNQTAEVVREAKPIFTNTGLVSSFATLTMATNWPSTLRGSSTCAGKPQSGSQAAPEGVGGNSKRSSD